MLPTYRYLILSYKYRPSYLRFKMEDVIGDCEVVLEPERGQDDAIANREGQPHLTWKVIAFGKNDNLVVNHKTVESMGA